MIKNQEKLARFDREYQRKQRVDIAHNFLIVESLYAEAVYLGTFSRQDPLDGLEVDIKIAEVINNVSKTP